MNILFKKGKWLIGSDSVHLVIDINGNKYYTDVKSIGSNFTLVEELETYDTDYEELTFDQMKEIESKRWNKDLELVNYILGENKSVSDYKKEYKI